MTGLMRALSLLFVGLFGSLARAHTPGHVTTNGPFVVTNPKISWGIYGEFVTGTEHFIITLELDERFAAPVEVFVPHEAALKNHRPAWALVGPGLPAPSAEELAALPAPLPEGFGAIVDLNTVDPRPAFYEFVLRRFYWSSGAMNVVMPIGKSELWVWSPAHTRGKFGLGYGVEEGGGYTAAFADWAFYAY
jgi:hypothetical protein